ncbi:MAG: hypothetical protein C5B50_19215 [Verrucomicrobia bacterium]|nr:MAG: hypothetical protein C5B50_19215 [Verrucomicrobiota bacterium]
MRSPVAIICGFVLLVIAAAFFWQLNHRASPSPEPNFVNTANISQTHSSGPGNKPDQTLLHGQPMKPEVAEAKRGELLSRQLEQRNVPIDFCGRVIDQDTNALAAVAIKISIRHWPTAGVLAPGVSEEIHLDRLTDSDGRFEVHGETGDALSVLSLEKQAYELTPTTPHHYPSSSGTVENPVLFKMWSTNIQEHLVTLDKSFRILTDGRPYFINLVAGTIAESGEGDLRVFIKYPMQVVRGATNDWSCRIDGVTCGILEQSDGSDPMYLAPTQGYVSSFELKQQIKGGQRGSTGQRRFYIRLGNGQEYGRIEIGLYAPYNYQIPGLIRLSYAINPSGSRILR